MSNIIENRLCKQEKQLCKHSTNKHWAQVLSLSSTNHTLHTGSDSQPSMKNFCFSGLILFLVLFIFSKETEKHIIWHSTELLPVTTNAEVMLNMKGCFFLSDKKT